jgi:chromosome segregation ATPase
MKRTVAISSTLLLAASLVACGGSKGKSGDTSAEAEVDLSAMDELKGLSTELQAGIDELMQPIDDSQAVIDEITALPQKLNLDAKSLMSMASATVENGTVSIDANMDLEAEARAEVEAVLGKLQAIIEGLKATPERVKLLGTKAAGAVAKVPVLATKIQTTATAKLGNPLASAESQAQAQADLDSLAQVKGDVQAQIQDVQAKIQGIPAMATEALAKLTAAFAGGAST